MEKDDSEGYPNVSVSQRIIREHAGPAQPIFPAEKHGISLTTRCREHGALFGCFQSELCHYVSSGCV